MDDRSMECPKCTPEKNHHPFAKYCDKHNVCVDCGIHRSKLTEAPWSAREGAFLCKPCEEIDRNKRIKERQENGFDHEYTDEIVCPHCGFEYSDSWESSDGEKECYECGEKFHMVRNVEVTYVTYK